MLSLLLSSTPSSPSAEMTHLQSVPMSVMPCLALLHPSCRTQHEDKKKKSNFSQRQHFLEESSAVVSQYFNNRRYFTVFEGGVVVMKLEGRMHIFSHRHDVSLLKFQVNHRHYHIFFTSTQAYFIYGHCTLITFPVTIATENPGKLQFSVITLQALL